MKLPAPLRTICPLALVLSYWLLCYSLMGLRSDHLVVGLLAIAAYYLHPKTREFIASFAIYLLYWAIYDLMRAFPNYRYNTVHIAELYNAEKNLFGINIQGNTLTPCEYFAQHTHALLDILGGLFYITWVPIPVAIAFYLWYSDKAAFKRFTYLFLGANFIGFFIYYLYPAAPPWYVAQYGFQLQAHVPASPAGLTRFDSLLGVSVFKGMYGMGANVFAAMPSLHSANPAVLLLFGWNYFKRARLALLLFGIGIWFSAVYLNHHYLLDVLGGITCAVLAWVVVQYGKPYHKE